MAENVSDILIAIRADNKDMLAKMDASQKSINKLQNKGEQSANAMAASFTSAFKKIAAVAIAKFSISAIKDMVKLAAGLDSVSQSFKSLASNADGGSKQLLKSIKKASAGTVSDLEIMRSSNMAIQLMGEEVMSQLPNMMEIARAAAKTQGVSVQKMYDDIIVASGRQSVQILDNLGISSATAKQYQAEYAASLGTTTDKLNDQQKAASFFYAVQKAGGELIKDVSSSTRTFGENLQVLDSLSNSTKENFAEGLTPGLTDLTNAFINSASGSGILAKGLAFVAKVASKAMSSIANLIGMVDLKMNERSANQYRELANDALDKRKEVRKQIAQQENLGNKSKVEELKKEDERLRGEFKKNFDLAQQYVEAASDNAKAMREITWDDVQDELENDIKKIKKNANTTTAPPSGSSSKAPKKSDTEYENFVKGNADIGKSPIQAEIDNLIAQRDKLLQAYEASEEKQTEIKKAYDEKRKKLDDDYTQYVISNAASVSSAVTNFVGQLGEMYANSSNRKIENIDREYDRQKQSLESSMMDEMAKEAALTELDKQHEAQKRAEQKKAFDKEKKFNIAQTILGIPKAVFDAFKSLIGVPIVGPVIAPLAATSAGVFGAAQLKMIQETQPPVYARGYIPNDHYLAYISGSEAIINAESTKANHAMLSAMNSNPGASLAQGGNSLNVTVQGSVISQDELAGIVDTYQQRQARDNGYDLYKRKR